MKSTPLRILFVCAYLNQHGGFENYVRALARSAVKAGHQVKILTPYRVRRDATIRRLPESVSLASAQEGWSRAPAGRFIWLLAQAKFRILRRRSPDFLEETGLARGRARGYVERFWQEEGRLLFDDTDLVHLFGKPKRFLVEAAACAAASGTKTIYSEIAHVDRSYAEHPDHRDFIGSSNYCTMVLAYSELQLRGIREWFEYSGPARVIDQYAYENEDELLRISRPRGPRDDGRLIFGTLCRLSPEKDLGLLIRAFALARELHPGLRLSVAGTGVLEAELRELGRTLGLESVVDFTGYVSDTADFYKSIDVFVISSREEGGPITGVEAMAAELPIISTRVNAMPERLAEGRDALFFDVGSVGELSEAICRLADDCSLREKLGTAARKRYLQRCSAQKREREIVQVWNDVAFGERCPT